MLSQDITNRLATQFGTKFEISSFQSLGGGSINQAARIESKQGDFFIKWNSAAKFPEMFQKESDSLKILTKTDTIRIPKVIMANEEGEESFLFLEYIEQGNKSSNFWQDFAYALAQLHRNTQSQYGLTFDNYIGSLPQSNQMYAQWNDFFVEERLHPQIKMARDSSLLDKSIILQFEKLFNRLDSIFPVEKPALLHGDLWSGNFMVDKHGNACIFDPAIYFGNRIMDIGMTQMFGGFAPEFYQLYNEAFPMENNWKEQLDIANLYPNLVHLNLFGYSYLSGIKVALSRFS